MDTKLGTVSSDGIGLSNIIAVIGGYKDINVEHLILRQAQDILLTGLP